MADYSKLKVAELGALLKQRDVPTKGLTRKQQMIDALEEDDQATSILAPAPGKVNLKRAASPSLSDDDKIIKKSNLETADAQVAQSQFATEKTLHIPIDNNCPLTTYRVHVDPVSSIIYDASLNQTNASNNNNKFYKVQLLRGPSGDSKTWTRWGRVGEKGQSALLGDGALNDAILHFEKKFKDKSGLKWLDRGSDPKPNKYVFVERSYDFDDDGEDDNEEEGESSVQAKVKEKEPYVPPKCTLQPQVESLMKLIFNEQYFAATMESLNYDSDKLPLGKLSKATIIRGFQALKDLSALLDDASLAVSYQMSLVNAIEHLSNRFYSLIPHAFGRNRPPVINNRDMLKREIELLESLSDLKDADNIIKADDKDGRMHPLDSRFQALGLQEMTPLAQQSEEYSEISKYLVNTRGQTHNVDYTIQDIFRIERQGELQRFQQSEFSKIDSDRRLLWHGSRATNFGGILGQGLRIAPPEAPVSGYMFDKGIYLADMSSKSANYCYSYTSDDHALLLLCEAELGKPMQTLKHAMYDAGTEAKKLGVYSTWGQGMIGPRGWKDAKCVHPSLAGVMMPDTTNPPGFSDIHKDLSLQYNEYICYDLPQVRLRYLLRVKM